MSKELINALGQLDATNDAHWTADGLPVLAVVTGFLGKPATRVEINAVAKGFSRSNTTPVQGGNGMSRPDGALVSNDGQSDEDAEAAESIKQELAEAETELQVATKRHRAAVAAMDAFIVKRDALSATTFTQDIQRFQAAQSKQRVEKVASENAMKAFLKEAAAKAKAE